MRFFILISQSLSCCLAHVSQSLPKSHFLGFCFSLCFILSLYKKKKQVWVTFSFQRAHMDTWITWILRHVLLSILIGFHYTRECILLEATWGFPFQTPLQFLFFKLKEKLICLLKGTSSPHHLLSLVSLQTGQTCIKLSVGHFLRVSS